MYDKSKLSYHVVDKHSPTSSRRVSALEENRKESPVALESLSYDQQQSNNNNNPSIRNRAKMFEQQQQQHNNIDDGILQQRRKDSSPLTVGKKDSKGSPSPGSTHSSRKTGNSKPRREKGANNNTEEMSHGTSNNSKDRGKPQQQQLNDQGEPDAVVTPELLVDALSGHEDGLLAIAERLMEHYDGGYDVMGEAIIDAFADVQKLFQHVVEAAHMEGAAFEASRRETEMTNNKNNNNNNDPHDMSNNNHGTDPAANNNNNPQQQSSITRHDEFIDQDVRDVLSDAIRAGQVKKDAGSHMECYELFEEACNNASSLLPVDSDHRGRLQLSIARAESMSPERACAILRYSMDDVLRSGRNLNMHQNPDPSQRGDCVLTRHRPLADGASSVNNVGSVHTGAAATQSPEEALASLVEEMREVLSAPVYENTPVQEVAKRFWLALTDAQKISSKNEERLENNLGQLKGEFLLARAEWEEKLNEQSAQSESFRKKYYNLKDQHQQTQYMDAARNSANNIRGKDHNNNTSFTPDASDGIFSCGSSPMSANSNKISRGRSNGGDNHHNFNNTSNNHVSGAASVASIGSALGQHARSLVGSIGCYGMGDTAGPTVKKTRGSPKNISSRNSSPPSVTGSSNSTGSNNNNGRRRTSRGMR